MAGHTHTSRHALSDTVLGPTGGTTTLNMHCKRMICTVPREAGGVRGRGGYLVKKESCTHSKVCLDVVNLRERQEAQLRHRTTRTHWSGFS